MSKRLSEMIPSEYYPLFKNRQDTDPRYWIYKGGRASCKSSSISIYIASHIIKNPLSNVVIIRANENTLRDSVYEQMKWGIAQLGAIQDFRFLKSPLEIIYKPTGQRIIFKGANNPQSITSITVSKGVIDTIWFEEMFQIQTEKQFNMIDLSFRGEMPKGYKIRIIGSFNPWLNTSWLKSRFFDKQDSNIYSVTTTYKCNKWLSKDDIRLFEDMERDDPQRYEVEGKGSWGVLSGLVYSNWHIEDFDHKVVSGIYSYGGDFGYVNSYTGLIQIKVDTVNKQLYVCKEIMYAREVVNSDIADAIKRNHMENEVWIFDCAEMKSIAELKRLGIRNAKPCAKGKDSVMYGISCIKEYKIIVHPDCVNTINELQSYMWKQDGNGKEMNEVIKDYDHILDAIRYAIQPFHKDKAKAKAISTFGLGI